MAGGVQTFTQRLPALADDVASLEQGVNKMRANMRPKREFAAGMSPCPIVHAPLPSCPRPGSVPTPPHPALFRFSIEQ